MAIDISQFHHLFFEESFEALEVMEADLLRLIEGDTTVETINTIFRSAHSIKSGAATFGFDRVAEFTHLMETLFDEMRMRKGVHQTSINKINLLLEGVDVLKEMLLSIQQKYQPDDERIAGVRSRLEQLVSRGSMPTPDDKASAITLEPALYGWKIWFYPYPHILQTGNDPLRMFRELASLGDLQVSVDDSLLPEFADLQPEQSYLSWTLQLDGAVSEASVREVFDWVGGDGDLTFEPLLKPGSSSSFAGTELAFIEQNSAVITEGSNQANTAITATNSSIRVGSDKVDSLINLAGELVITQSMLSKVGNNFDMAHLPQLMAGLSQLERNTHELQESIMQICMLPISSAFNRLPRLVHDLSGKMGKKVQLELLGEQTELDKSALEKIADPLVHLVRNALDHGLETATIRQGAGKGEIGLLRLHAYHHGGNILVDIHDDGAGLNEEKILAKALASGLVSQTDTLTTEKIHQLIFLPGFSTADTLSDISGRGVGMDVVRKNIHQLGGSVKVKSEQGKGTTFTLRLPQTLAIMDGQTIQTGAEKFILPLISIVESLEVNSANIKQEVAGGESYPLRDEYVPIIRLDQIFNLSARPIDVEDGILLVVEAEGQQIGLLVDDLLGQQQVVVKSLETNYRKVIGIAGATILGDGTVALILDIPGLLALHQDPSLAAPKVHAVRAA